MTFKMGLKRGRGGASRAPRPTLTSVFAQEEPAPATCEEAAPGVSTSAPAAGALADQPRPPRVRQRGEYRFGHPYRRWRAESAHAADIVPVRALDGLEVGTPLGKGSHAQVFLASDKASGQTLALKRFAGAMAARGGGESDAEDEGIATDVLRECTLLQSLRHPNVIRLAGSFHDGDDLFLAMEAVDYDVGHLIEHMPTPFSEGQIKCLFMQLLSALAALHEQWVVHRDLKQTNLLLTKGSVLKLCDFGMARRLGSCRRPLTPGVTSHWYRAPEVLLGDRHYTTAVDMWAAGVILGEWLAKGQPLFAGAGDVDQVQRIFGLLGTPTHASWPQFFDGSLPLAGRLHLVDCSQVVLDATTGQEVRMPRSTLRKLFPVRGYDPCVPSTVSFSKTGLSNAGYALLSSALCPDPHQRVTAEAALAQPWFSEKPDLEPLSRFDIRQLQKSRAHAIRTGAHQLTLAAQAALPRHHLPTG